MNNITLDDKHIYRVGGVVYPGVSEILDGAGLVHYPNTQQVKDKAELGTNVHLAIKMFLRGGLDETQNFDGKEYFEGFMVGFKRYGFKPQVVEQHLFSKKYGFCGTPDLLDTEGILWDWKISAVIHPAVELQLASYKILFEENGYKVKERRGLQLSPGGCKVYPYKEKIDEYQFLNVLGTYRWIAKNQKIITPEMSCF